MLTRCLPEWCPQVDLVFKRYLQDLQDVYKRYSGRFRLPGEWLCLWAAASKVLASLCALLC